MSFLLDPFRFGAPPGPYGSHRYWRIYIDSNGGDTNTVIRNLIMRSSPGGAQIATGGTASAGGSGADGSGTVPSDAFIGGPYQRTAASAWFIAYDFGSNKSIVEIAFATENSVNRQIISARLQYSDDNSTWSDAFSIWDPLPENLVSATWPQDLTGASGYKAYRFVWTATSTSNRTVIGELEFLLSGVDQAVAAKASSTIGGETNLFDNNTSTSATSLATGAGTVVISLNAPLALNGYSVNSGANAARAPRDWTVAASNDGTTWTTLDTKTGITFATNQLTKTYSF